MVSATRELSLDEALGRLHHAFACRGIDTAPDGPPRKFHILGEPASRTDLYVPELPLERLGDPTFRSDHRLKYAYVAGAMANGIASAELVEALGTAGMLGFFGAAGLSFAEVNKAVERLAPQQEHMAVGFNLIHSPNEPDLESAVADLFLRHRIRLVEASAFLDLTLPIVRFRTHGIHTDNQGRIVTPHQLIAKVSRVEVAAKFMAPPPAAMLKQLVNQGDLTPQQADLARRIPVARDITAEADSAGHTDNRPALTLFPTLSALRDRLQLQYGYTQPLRIGAAGGIGTPAAVAAVFTMGAAYVVTGTVNQACVESGSSDAVRQMLAQAEQADTMMAPAADMFEMGIKVQVLKRGTMFPMRATKLYELYRTYNSLEEISPQDRSTLEKTVFQAPLSSIWQDTVDFFRKRDPQQIERAQRDPKHKMALVFRWYLGLSSRWANRGEPSRRMDYQVWCGPAMGAFNEWTKGSFLERPAQRRVVTIALNLLHGAAVLLRANGLRWQGASLPNGCPCVTPRTLAELESLLR